MIASTQFRRLIVAGFTLGSLLVCGLAAYSLNNSSQDRLHQATVETQNIALVVDQAVSFSLRRIDLVLHTTADELERQQRAGGVRPKEMNAFLDRLQQRLPEVDGIRITDARGVVILGPGVEPAHPVSLGDRNYFQRLKSSPDASLQVSDPIFGRLVKKWVVTFARRYNHPDGTFAGIISAPVTLDYLSGLLSGLNLGPQGAIILRKDDMSMLVRQPPFAAPRGNEPGNKLVSPELTEIVRSGVAHTSYTTVVPADGIERIVSFRRLGSAPMIVTVSVGREAYLASWRAEAYKTGAIVLLFLLLSLFSARLLIRAMEQAADESLRNRLYLQRASDGIHILDGHGNVVEANEQFCAMLGYPREEVIGMCVTQWDARWDAQTLLGEIIPRNLQQEGSATFETLHRRRNGTIFEVEISATSFASGGQRYIYAASRDITQRKLDEKQLRLGAAVLRSTREGVVITDLHGIIQAINPAFTQITGYTEADAVGRSNSILKSNRQDRTFYQNLWHALKEVGHWQGEIWNRRRDGDVYPQLLTISTVCDENGQPTNYVGVFTDISQLKASEAELKHLAHHDALTGLPNRMLLLSRLDHALTIAQRSGKHGAVLFIDLDRFKDVNDSLGHPAGDELLQLVTRRFKERLRDSDTLARLGGDEFVVLLEEIAAPDDAAEVATQLIEQLREPFNLHGEHTVYLGCSIGIALYPEDAADTHSLIQYADTALYQSKNRGRGTFHFYTESMGALATQRMAMESALRRALEGGELILHYQPLMALEGGQAVGAEALVRWQPPQGEMVPPDRFIPLAEDTGLIVPLGNWVLRTACTQACAWRAAGIPLQTIAVNVSPRQLSQGSFAEEVAAALAESGLPPEVLELELTEGALMEQGAEAEARLEALKALGVRLAIDDFGTGYSSLAYLKRLPIDKLKIDRSFVRDVPQDSADMEIVATIIAMAKNLHLEVLAEGIESEVQLQFLRTRACDLGQGYLFSKPLAPVNFQRWWQENGS
ncbi:MAG TPA: EAL domain-containing protein [Rhodocyclaceae bacterium]